MTIPLNTYALVSLQEAKSYLQEDPIANLGTKEDLIGRLVNSISTLAETYMNRKILSRSYTNEDYDGTGTDTLQLKNYPIISVESLYDDIDRNFTAAHLISSGNIIIYAEEGKIKRKGVVLSIDENTGKIFRTASFSRSRKNVRVNYTAGYAATPDDIKLVVLEEIVWHYDRIIKKNLGVMGVSAMGENVSVFVGKLLETTEMILSAYRKPLR